MSNPIIDQLGRLWAAGRERCGLILDNGSVVELTNIHPHPLEAFEFDVEEFHRYPLAIATWHTHPRTTGNLSIEDFHLFLQLHRLWHYIVGPDGDIRCYQVEDGRVLLHDSPDQV